MHAHAEGGCMPTNRHRCDPADIQWVETESYWIRWIATEAEVQQLAHLLLHLVRLPPLPMCRLVMLTIVATASRICVLTERIATINCSSSSFVFLLFRPNQFPRHFIPEVAIVVLHRIVFTKGVYMGDGCAVPRLSIHPLYFDVLSLNEIAWLYWRW
jgi:hypothetical protein